MSNTPELVVLLDETYKPIGQIPKEDVHSDHTPLHLAFSCHIFNEKNELLLTQRSFRKKVWPGVWTGSFCGHPSPDESLEQALYRRASYELNMAVYDIRLVLPEYRYITPPFKGIVENEFCPVYFGRMKNEDDILNPNPDEVCDYQWIDIETLLQDISLHEEKYSYWLKDQLKQLVERGVI